ncbi:hypothetical protein CY34DRAFT_81144 [Suillus luteus UH-Slu-Lm8-n1]|uniref:Unplaced genomic scaffold CY34scaffold_73, whole genome shotgun sequence n=1 Tax=Suillus luteus UH-Slu-Lm8-n1 TaxID=930992 RepID=A0A0D0BBY6_9AGAM|nr:hypothetical protein CY34DRAFT_81144 [Suillus luteus UH-Slu-Lm8-n1]
MQATTTTPTNPTPPSKSYNFSREDMKNTKIFNNQPASPLYSVVTDIKSDKRTDIFDARGNRLLARVDKRDILPDTITFPNRNNGSSINLSKWLQKSKLEDGHHVHSIETAHGTYVWKSDANYRLALYRKGDMSSPVAHLQQGSRTQNFAVIMQGEAELIRDDVIVSFLILEQRLRISEKHIDVGGGKFDQNRTVLGHHVNTP